MFVLKKKSGGSWLAAEEWTKAITFSAVCIALFGVKILFVNRQLDSIRA